MCDTVRKRTFSIQEVLPFIRYGISVLPVHRVYEGEEVRMNTATLKTFALHGTKCTKCGLEGLYFALERTPNNKQDNKFHFNLYGKNDQGDEILFTKDHIMPKSKGGKSTQENLQTMCQLCNQDKGAKVPAVHHTYPYLIIEEKLKISAENFLRTISVNVDNNKLSDKEFRQFIRNTLPIVKF